MIDKKYSMIVGWLVLLVVAGLVNIAFFESVNFLETLVVIVFSFAGGQTLERNKILGRQRRLRRAGQSEVDDSPAE